MCIEVSFLVTFFKRYFLKRKILNWRHSKKERLLNEHSSNSCFIILRKLQSLGNSCTHRFSIYRNRKSSVRNTVILMLERLVAFNIGIINRIKRGKGVEFQPINRPAGSRRFPIGAAFHLSNPRLVAISRSLISAFSSTGWVITRVKTDKFSTVRVLQIKSHSLVPHQVCSLSRSLSLSLFLCLVFFGCFVRETIRRCGIGIGSLVLISEGVRASWPFEGSF